MRPRAHVDWFNLFRAAPGGASCKPDGFDPVAQRTGGNGDARPLHCGQAPRPVAVPVQFLPVDERDGAPDVGLTGMAEKITPPGPCGESGGDQLPSIIVALEVPDQSNAALSSVTSSARSTRAWLIST